MRYKNILCCSIMLLFSACVANVSEEELPEKEAVVEDAADSPSWREEKQMSSEDCRSFYREHLPGKMMEVPVECHPFVVDPYSQISNPPTEEEEFFGNEVQKNQ